MKTDLAANQPGRTEGAQQSLKHHLCRIFIVEDHALMRIELATLFQDDERFTVVGDAGSYTAALASVDVCADVLLLDVQLGDGNGIVIHR